jgi:hypothetical protein
MATSAQILSPEISFKHVKYPGYGRQFLSYAAARGFLKLVRTFFWLLQTTICVLSLTVIGICHHTLECGEHFLRLLDTNGPEEDPCNSLSDAVASMLLLRRCRLHYHDVLLGCLLYVTLSNE